MICRPKYNVIYRGEFHPSGTAFEIYERDVEEMSSHGVIEEQDEDSGKPEEQDENSGKPEEQKRKVGRPRKGE